MSVQQGVPAVAPAADKTEQPEFYCAWSPMTGCCRHKHKEPISAQTCADDHNRAARRHNASHIDRHVRGPLNDPAELDVYDPAVGPGPVYDWSQEVGRFATLRNRVLTGKVAQTTPEPARRPFGPVPAPSPAATPTQPVPSAPPPAAQTAPVAPQTAPDEPTPIIRW